MLWGSTVPARRRQIRKGLPSGNTREPGYRCCTRVTASGLQTTRKKGIKRAATGAALPATRTTFAAVAVATAACTASTAAAIATTAASTATAVAATAATRALLAGARLVHA